MLLFSLLVSLVPLALAKDLGVRFSKVLIDPRYNMTGIDLPLRSKHYPIDTSTFRWLRYQIASTVLIQKVCVECFWPVADLIDMAGGYP